MECLGELERLSQAGLIDLYYGDESRVSVDPCVPYGWQFAGEEVFMPAAKEIMPGLSAVRRTTITWSGALANISRVLKEESVRQALREASGPEAFLDVLRSAEAVHIPQV